jgi:SAM-dependent methyltransferase
MPNDDYEQIRLSLVHRIFIDIFDGKLTSTPLDDPELILDVGTGIGEWAIGMADLYPDCEVIGTDISAIQPTSVPTNCFFEVDDAELEWTREPDSFDLIHFRNLLGCFSDWHLIYDEAFRALKPGGWIELIDFDESNGGLSGFVAQFPPDSDIHELFPNYLQAVEKSGRVRGLAHLNPSWLNRAGFVDIKVTDHVIPIDNEAGGGRLWLISCIDGLEAMCLRTMTQYGGWEPDRVKQSCYNVAKEMALFAKDPVKAKGLTMNVRVVIGRKPLMADGERSPVAPCSGAASPEHGMAQVTEGQTPAP